MKDYIVRATAGDGQIRAFAATTGNLVEEARKRHDTSPVATAALGRLLTAGAMMGGMMKNETDVLTLQIKGDGPLGGITVTADAKGDVKGYVDHPEAMLPPNEWQAGCWRSCWNRSFKCDQRYGTERTICWTDYSADR